MARTHDRPWRPRDDSSRHGQRRLLFLVFSLALILVLMQRTRRPENWYWLWSLGGGPTSGVPTVDGGPPAHSVDRHDRATATDTRQPDPAGLAPLAAAGQWEKGRLLPGIEPRYLTVIQDHTVFRPVEHDAWFNLLKVLKAHTEPELRRAAHGYVGFVELFHQPNRYRGQLVTVRGQARRVLFRHAPKNDSDVPGYWQVVVRPAGGPPSPLILYCLDLPSQFPTGAGIREEIVVRGLFFKNWAFSTGTEIHSFPTLLARTMEWSRADPVARVPVRASYVLAMLVGTAVAGVLAAAWVCRRSRQIAAPGRHAGQTFRPGPFVVMLVLCQAASVVAGPDRGTGPNRAAMTQGAGVAAEPRERGPVVLHKSCGQQVPSPPSGGWGIAEPCPSRGAEAQGVVARRSGAPGCSASTHPGAPLRWAPITVRLAYSMGAQLRYAPATRVQERTLRVCRRVAGVEPRGTSGEPPELRHLPGNILEQAGIDQGLLYQLVDGRPLAHDDPLVVLKLLYHVRRLDRAFTDRWAQGDIPWPGLLQDPSVYRGQMFTLAGRVAGITRRETPPEWVDRFALEGYYRCDVRLGDNHRPAIVLTPHVPRAWPADGALDERVGASAMFLKLAKDNRHDTRPVFVARRLAWYPDKVDTRSGVNFGMAVLGDLGMDVGLWDHVENRKPLTARDHEPFFQVLAAVEKAGTRQLIRLARRDLATRVPPWQTDREQLTRRLDALSRQPEERRGDPDARAAWAKQVDEVRKRLTVVRQSLAQARRGTFPVVPLFNEPDRQFGRLVVLEGTACRVVKITVGSPDGPSGAGDVWERFRMEHYYEIEMFTDDSQNNPIVFCVRHLPDGLRVGANVHEPVRIAGFFFKSWAYTRAANRSAGDAADATRRREWQLAPLLIGREPLRLRPVPGSGRSHVGLVAGGLFVLALLGVWYTLWRNARGDRRFDQRIRTLRDADVPGVSLDELGAGTTGRGPKT